MKIQGESAQISNIQNSVISGGQLKSDFRCFQVRFNPVNYAFQSRLIFPVKCTIFKYFKQMRIMAQKLYIQNKI